MIEPQQLRIGNWVMKGHRNDFEQISHVSDHKGTRGVIFYNQRDGYGHDMPYDLEFIHPIPLTEQWLEDFGFERHYNGKNCDYAKDGVGLCYEVDDDSWWYSGHSKSRIKHVHDLQNLFWCLTGQELELKKQ